MKITRRLMVLWMSCALASFASAMKFETTKSQFQAESKAVSKGQGAAAERGIGDSPRIRPGQVGERLPNDQALFDLATTIREGDLSPAGRWTKENISFGRPVLDLEFNLYSRSVLKSIMEAPDRVNMPVDLPGGGKIVIVQSESVRQGALFIDGKEFAGFGTGGTKALPGPTKLPQLEYKPGPKLSMDIKGPSVPEVKALAQKSGIKIANEGATLPDREIHNFIGLPERALVQGGETLYGIRAADSRSVWWTRQKPKGELQWRTDQAVLEKWNKGTHFEVLEVPKGQGLIGFEGPARDQKGYIGGGNQIYIPEVPEGWMRRTEWK